LASSSRGRAARSGSPPAYGGAFRSHWSGYLGSFFGPLHPCAAAKIDCWENPSRESCLTMSAATPTSPFVSHFATANGNHDLQPSLTRRSTTRRYAERCLARSDQAEAMSASLRDLEPLGGTDVGVLARGSPFATDVASRCCVSPRDYAAVKLPCEPAPRVRKSCNDADRCPRTWPTYTNRPEQLRLAV